MIIIGSDASLQGWGATCEGKLTRGPWSPQEQTLHINCLELLAATLAIQTFAKERSGISVLLRIDNTTAVAYINRKGGTVSPTLSHLEKTMWLWCMERNISLKAQHLPGVMNSIADRESRAWSDRSEWKLSPKIFQRINSQLGPLSTDLFASRLSNQLPTFVSWKPDPPGNGDRCIYIDLVGSSTEDLCEPSLEHDRQSPVTHMQSKHSRAHPGGSRVESSSLVPTAPTETGQSTTPHTQIIRNDTTSVSEPPPRHPTPTSCVGHIRERCQRNHLSGTATDLVLSSWREKSSKSYDTCFRKWASWCSERNRDPICGPISDVANFLAELYQNGYQYRSLNSYRSLISTTHEQVDGCPVGQHPTIIRLMKGAFNQRPPQPKYSTTWDVCIVTRHITVMGENGSLPLKSLSLKLVLLLAYIDKTIKISRPLQP